MENREEYWKCKDATGVERKVDLVRKVSPIASHCLDIVERFNECNHHVYERIHMQSFYKHGCANIFNFYGDRVELKQTADIFDRSLTMEYSLSFQPKK